MALGPATVNGVFNAFSSRQFLAAQGAYFTATNPTPGTAIAFAQLTSFSATANGLFVIQNPGNKTIIVDRLTLTQTATAPTGTFIRLDIWNETGIVVGTTAVATRTPVQLNPAPALSQGSSAVIQSFAAGAITIPAAASGATRRLIDSCAQIPIGVEVAQDVYVWDFGADGPSAGSGGATAARATDPARKSGTANPVIVPPNTTTWMNCFGPGTSTPSYEFALSWAEVQL